MGILLSVEAEIPSWIGMELKMVILAKAPKYEDIKNEDINSLLGEPYEGKAFGGATDYIVITFLAVTYYIFMLGVIMMICKVYLAILL